MFKKIISIPCLILSLCAQDGIAQTADALIECARKAIAVNNLTSDQAVKLCVNGGSAETAECAKKAMGELNLSADQAVELCASKVLRLDNVVKFVQ
jgi:hypothetical protein